jgi:ectoine hydroxylase-related dioxygenase (phytanoyl-CoA dioxygenase family)
VKEAEAMTAVETERDGPWDLEALPKPTRDEARLIADMDAWGYCLVAEALPAEQLAAILERLESQAEAERKYGYHITDGSVQDPEGQNQWILMLINKGKAFQQVLHHPLVTAVLDHVLGRDHILSEASAHITRPGNSLLSMHTDQWWMPPPVMPGASYKPAGEITRSGAVTGPLKRAEHPIAAPMCVQTMTMVSDFTEANGATRLVPGSHLTGVQPDQSVPHTMPSVPAVGPAGTIAMWEGRTWHSAGANSTNAPRYGMPTLYAAPQMRTLQNFTYGTKAEVVEAATPELRKLLGFKSWSGYGMTNGVDRGWATSAEETIGELEP